MVYRSLRHLSKEQIQNFKLKKEFKNKSRFANRIYTEISFGN